MTRAVLLCLGLALVAALPTGANAAPHEHGPSPPASGVGSARIGVLVADHGEPPIYNADTYESMREFIHHLMEMGVIPSWLRSLDTGTVLQDPGCYGCGGAAGTRFMDAWLGEHTGPAAPMPSPTDDIPAHYVLPRGPGAGEPDIFEHAGLQTWHEWELMGGRSPNYDQKLEKKRVAIRALRRRYGKRVAVAVGYGIDPRIDGGRQDLHSAVQQLIDAGAGRIVVVYHGVGFSDLMQTHMIRHDIEHSLDEHGVDIPVTYAAPMGMTRPYLQSVVAEAKRHLSRVPAKAPVAIHLSGHGLPTAECGDYNCGADSYHAFSAQLFERARARIERAIARPGETGIFRLYGDGATDEDDPEDLVDSPVEALGKRAEAGFTHVIDIPYEFDSDSRDTLIVLRQGYERPIPDWNRRYVSRFDYRGMEVTLGNASFGPGPKTDALIRVTTDALDAASDPRGQESNSLDHE